MTEKNKITIVELGDSSDGIALLNDKKIFIPFALPNEEIEFEIVKTKRETNYKLINVLTKSPNRTKPICPYFTKCGGCCTQHLNEDAYNNFKMQILNNALSHKNLYAIKINPLLRVGQNQRRRVSLSYKNFGDNFVLGFKEASTHFTINIPHCPLIVPELNAILKPTYDLLKNITSKGETGFVNITVLENGLDFVWSPHRVPTIDYDLTEKFIEFGQANNCVQITRAGKEIIYISKTPVVKFDDALIPFPPSAFLQPSIQGENLLIETVLSFINSSVIASETTQSNLLLADLFCGLGTFTIPLSKLGQVFAYDIFSPSVEKLKEYGKGKISAISQNLFEEPIKSEELNKFNVIVLDPPRAGADAQCRELANSTVKHLIYISCDPSTFARDAKMLTDNGYLISEITPVDQFPYTDHLEIIALFTK